MSIRVRKARLRDIAFVRRLAIESVAWGIPHTRDVPPEHVKAAAGASLETLEVTLAQRDFVILIAEEMSPGTDDGAAPATPCGYIMLDLRSIEASTGEPQCLIHDLAVQRDYWGRHVVTHLIREAEAVTASRGLSYLVGQVTAANERSLGTALRWLGFEVERYQIVRRVSEPPRRSRREAQRRPPRRPSTAPPSEQEAPPEG